MTGASKHLDHRAYIMLCLSCQCSNCFQVVCTFRRGFRPPRLCGQLQRRVAPHRIRPVTGLWPVAPSLTSLPPPLPFVPHSAPCDAEIAPLLSSAALPQRGQTEGNSCCLLLLLLGVVARPHPPAPLRPLIVSTDTPFVQASLIAGRAIVGVGLGVGGVGACRSRKDALQEKRSATLNSHRLMLPPRRNMLWSQQAFCG